MSDSGLTLDEALEDLVGAEDFLDFFGIAYDQKVVHVNRLHIMQRFHDYLQRGEHAMPADMGETARRALYTQLLQRAYLDFVGSDAQTEKVFKVFKMHEPQTTFVPIEQLFGG